MKERMNDDDNNKTRREMKKKIREGVTKKKKLLAIGSRFRSELSIDSRGSLFFLSERHYHFSVSFLLLLSFSHETATRSELE